MPEETLDYSQTVFETLRYVETLISHELALIGNRMTWFAITESFLFGAYTNVATDPQRLERAFSVTNTSGPMPTGATTISVLLLLTPALGIAIAIAAYLSVNAAGTVRAHLIEARADLQLRLNQILAAKGFRQVPVIGNINHRTTSGGAELGRTIRLGRMPEWVLPFAMITVWTVALLLRFRVQGLAILPP